MRRYWVPTNCFRDDQVQIEGDVFHHIFQVCRQRLGSRFEVIHTDSHQCFLVEVIQMFKDRAAAKVIGQRSLPTPSKPWINLNLCVPKFAVLESIIEKCVELGVHQVQLLFSDFSFVSDSAKVSPERLQRWNKIILSATQQSGRGDLMNLVPPIKLSTFLNQPFSQKDFVVFAYESDCKMTLQDACRQKAQRPVESIQLFVGPEGGFSQTEVQHFSSINILPTTLGEQILRVETACVSLISILKYEFGV
jgi:16S rRNA (uracil1498-N3)-methyltransferase